MNHTSKQDPDSDKGFMKYYGLVFELVVMNAALIWAGYQLDTYLKSTPAFILTGTLLAMAGTVWMLMNRLK